MTYLSRPVLSTPINWLDPVSKEFSFDLREVTLGFGAEIFTSLQQFVVQGWNFSLELTTPEAISEFDAFIDALSGRLNGFWLPTATEEMLISAAVSTTQFDIVGQNLTATWTERPDVHLQFSYQGITPEAAAITAVADLGGGLERVTLGTAINAALLVPGAVVNRLHYVRLASDVETARWQAEGWQKRTVSVVELPHEYTTAETGQRPVYLYHFWLVSPVDHHWYFTSFAGPVISNDKTYSPSPISHGQLRRSTRVETETLTIECGYQADHPVNLYIPFPPSVSLFVEVFDVNFADPDITTRLFTGQIRRVSDRGERLSVECDSFINVMNRKIPRMVVQKECNYQLYDQGTCKANQAQFETPAEIVAISSTALPPTVTVTLTFPTADRQSSNWFALGWLETGQQLQFELRQIISSTWDGGLSELTLALNEPLHHAVIGQGVILVPGCDGLPATCKDKFGNFENFGGFPNAPDKNLSLQAVENKVSQGDKK